MSLFQEERRWHKRRAVFRLNFVLGVFLVIALFPSPQIAKGFVLIEGGAPIIPPVFHIQKNQGRSANDMHTSPNWPHLFDRNLSRAKRAEPLTGDLQDAILRIEGIYDPTRVGMFGPALRMSVRPGSASMNNVFGDRWIISTSNPNLHYRVHYLAEAWLWPRETSCSLYFHVRPASSATLLLDILSEQDCEDIKALDDWHQMLLASWEPSLPIFDAPYPGSRLKPKDWQIEEAFVRASAQIASRFLKAADDRVAALNTVRGRRSRAAARAASLPLAAGARCCD